jgi:hypothetical protein
MADNTRKVVADLVTDALKEVAASPSTSLKERDVAPAAKAVTDNVTAAVQHATNTEPWYQSRVTWGAIIAVGGGLAGIAGYSVDVDDQAQIVNGIVGLTTAVGGLIAWYGRWRAKKPIGQ